MKDRLKAAIDRQIDKALEPRLQALIETQVHDAEYVRELEREFRHAVHELQGNVSDAQSSVRDLELNADDADAAKLKEVVEQMADSLHSALSEAADAAESAYNAI